MSSFTLSSVWHLNEARRSNRGPFATYMPPSDLSNVLSTTTPSRHEILLKPAEDMMAINAGCAEDR